MSPQWIGYSQPTVIARRPWSPWPLTFVSGLAASAMMAFLLTVLPNFDQIFRDFKVELPLSTRILIEVASVVRHYYLWLVIPVLATVVPALTVPLLPVPATDETRRTVRRLTRLAVTLVLTLLVVVVVLGMFAPMVALIDSVAAPSKK